MSRVSSRRLAALRGSCCRPESAPSMTREELLALIDELLIARAECDELRARLEDKEAVARAASLIAEVVERERDRWRAEAERLRDESGRCRITRDPATSEPCDCAACLTWREQLAAARRELLLPSQS